MASIAGPSGLRCSAHHSALATINSALPAEFWIPLADLKSYRQQGLSAAVDTTAFRSLYQRLDGAHRANLLSETLPGAWGFLNAVLSKQLGSLLSIRNS